MSWRDTLARFRCYASSAFAGACRSSGIDMLYDIFGTGKCREVTCEFAITDIFGSVTGSCPSNSLRLPRSRWLKTAAGHRSGSATQARVSAGTRRSGHSTSGELADNAGRYLGSVPLIRSPRHGTPLLGEPLMTATLAYTSRVALSVPAQVCRRPELRLASDDFLDWRLTMNLTALVSALAIAFLLASGNLTAGPLDPDCTAGKAAKSAAMKATVGIGGRCSAKEAAADT
jgi:hypothetical protein